MRPHRFIAGTAVTLLLGLAWAIAEESVRNDVERASE